jgi:polyisoprenoid-binding protein YceI
MRWRSLNRVTFTGLVLILFSNQAAYCQRLLVDKTKSTIDFEVTHLGVLTVNGSFNDFEGAIGLNGNMVEVSGTIKSVSINTGNTNRDENIRGKAYLNAEAYPEIVYSAIGTISGDSVNIEGPIKLRGVSHLAKLKCKYVSNLQLGCVTSIKRSDFKLNFGGMDALIGDIVSVKLNLFVAPIK